jgi:hypothetical protein
MKTKTSINRSAYTLAEVAEMFGRHRSWAYRLAKSGKIKTVKGYGAAIVPSYEIDKILGITELERGGADEQ